MTCIVGLIHNKTIVMGGDSAGVAGYGMSIRADEKVFINNGFIFGFTSSFRMGQILRFGFTPPKRHPDIDLYEYMVTDFIDAVRTRFRTAGYLIKDKEQELGGSFLVGHQGRLFVIHSDFQVGEDRDKYDAVGCGEDIAKGSLYATKKFTKFTKPVEAVQVALEAAENYSAGVRRPFTILTLK
jgi:ATP-dependent protease HslVU (ClpYQ) peptidase subunit